MGIFGNIFGNYYNILNQDIEPPTDCIYIDPDNNNSNRDGTINNPFKSFSEFSIMNNYIYKLKRNTILTTGTPIDLTSKSGVTISDYGTGELPKFEFTSSGYYALRIQNSQYCVINNLDIFTPKTNSVLALIALGSGTNFSGGSNNVISNCKLHSVKGSNGYGIGIRGGGSNIKILNCDIYDCDIDGMYIRDTTNLEIGYCNIHHVNQLYKTNTNQTYSSGDGIQLDGLWSNFHIHHNIIDRSDVNTGNKFCLILNSAAGKNDNSSGIVEYNTFMTNSNCPTQLYIEQGNGIITRYNIFKGVTAAIRITGKTTKNNLIHNNIIYNSSYGVGVAYVNGSPLNTRVYNNVFYNLTGANCWIDDTTIDLKNNIFVGSNVQLKLYRTAAASYIMENNCYGTTTNIGTMGGGTDYVVGDPLFLDKLNYNFRLNENSICINAGKNVNITRDFDGNSIPQGVLPDIGAFEYI